MTIKQIMAVLNQEIAWCRKNERAGAKKMPAKEYRRGYRAGLIQARALLSSLTNTLSPKGLALCSEPEVPAALAKVALCQEMLGRVMNTKGLQGYDLSEISNLLDILHDPHWRPSNAAALKA